MTKEEFNDWKRDFRTIDIMKGIQKECFDLAMIMARTAGVDQNQDNLNRGVIMGLEKVLSIDFEDDEENADTTAV